MVPVVALVSRPPAMVAAARVRLKAMTAQMSQGEFAANCPDDRGRTALERSLCSAYGWNLANSSASMTDASTYPSS